jgi:hypothetical protein
VFRLRLTAAGRTAADIGRHYNRERDLDLNGVVWTALSSGHLASFDRRKCKGSLNEPAAASGKHCPEGWTLYPFPGPQFKDVKDPGSADHAYYVWVDRYNTLGLGPNVPIAEANGSEALLALVNGKFSRCGAAEQLVPHRIGLNRHEVWRIEAPRAVIQPDFDPQSEVGRGVVNLNADEIVGVLHQVVGIRLDVPGLVGARYPDVRVVPVTGGPAP